MRRGEERRGGKEEGGRPAPAAHAQPPRNAAPSSSNPVPRIPGAHYPVSGCLPACGSWGPTGNRQYGVQQESRARAGLARGAGSAPEPLETR